MLIAEVILLCLSAYLLGGVVVSVPFVVWGVQHMDEAARGASPGFRLLILPGSIALWPWLVVRWFRSKRVGGHP